MAYTTPPTFVADTILTAADQNILSDDIKYLKAQTDLAVFSGVIVSRSSTPQSIADNTLTTISFLAETVDQGGWIAVTSTTVTVPAGAIPPGYTTVILDCRYVVNWAANTVGTRLVQFTLNGTAFAATRYNAASASGSTNVVAWKVVAAAGDTLTLQVQQTSGGALNVDPSVSIDVYRPYA